MRVFLFLIVGVNAGWAIRGVSPANTRAELNTCRMNLLFDQRRTDYKILKDYSAIVSASSVHSLIPKFRGTNLRSLESFAEKVLAETSLERERTEAVLRRYPSPKTKEDSQKAYDRWKKARSALDRIEELKPNHVPDDPQNDYYILRQP